MTEPTGTRARTRRAILDAAVEVLGQRQSASLAEVAESAGVGRSTLHRYFPDRASLVTALFADTVELMQRSFDEAALDQGTAMDALGRLISAFFELGPRMTFLFTEVGDDTWNDPALERTQWPVGALLYRGRAEGEFDPELDLEWTIRILWHLMPAGWEAVADGTMRRHEAIEALTRTMQNCVRIRADGS